MKKKASAVGRDIPENAPALPERSPAGVVGKSIDAWARWLILPVLLVGLLLGGAGASFWFKGKVSQHDEVVRKELETMLSQSRAGLGQANAQLDALQGQLMVEESTRKGLEASLQAAQAELGRARDQLAFYSQLLPPGPDGSISIRALDIERQGSILQYKVLLMRNGADGKPFKGLMRFVAKGSLRGKTVKIDLTAAKVIGASADAGSKPEANDFELSFDQFQRSGGILSLPEGFTPQTVTLNVLEGATVRVSRTVNLPAAD